MLGSNDDVNAVLFPCHRDWHYKQCALMFICIFFGPVASKYRLTSFHACPLYICLSQKPKFKAFSLPLLLISYPRLVPLLRPMQLLLSTSVVLIYLERRIQIKGVVANGDLPYAFGCLP